MRNVCERFMDSDYGALSIYPPIPLQHAVTRRWVLPGHRGSGGDIRWNNVHALDRARRLEGEITTAARRGFAGIQFWTGA